MRISSKDNTSSIVIELNEDSSGYSSFEMRVSVDIEHGKFEAVNTDLQFLNIDQFVREFDSFILKRDAVPTLLGTYNTKLSFLSEGLRLSVEYRLGDSFCGEKTVDFSHSGEFMIDQERLLGISEGFRSLFGI